MDKVLVILGQTATGKTKLAVKLAAKLNGEIISADSRQVYKGMDIGTGKDLQDFKIGKKAVKYHLIDVISPKSRFDLARYQKMAYRAINDVLRRGKLPIIVGGSGLYLQAIVDGYQFDSAKPELKKRKQLEKLSIKKLYSLLYKKNRKTALSLNESDRQNKVRLIRKLESANIKKINNIENKYEYILVGIKVPKTELEKKIKSRLLYRFEKQKMADEVKKLHKRGVSWKKLESFGLEYKFISQYLQGKLEYREMVEKLNIAIRQFAKRQATWFRRWERQGRKINWSKSPDKIIKLIK